MIGMPLSPTPQTAALKLHCVQFLSPCDLQCESIPAKTQSRNLYSHSQTQSQQCILHHPLHTPTWACCIYPHNWQLGFQEHWLIDWFYPLLWLSLLCPETTIIEIRWERKFKGSYTSVSFQELEVPRITSCVSSPHTSAAVPCMKPNGAIWGSSW